MPKIHILPPELVGLIAAGEVVERPAACLKELVENSMDAGATSISVSLEEGGLQGLRVTDNGQGIAPEDIKMAFVPHATSKLKDKEGLSGIQTLGFRGEALASIAQVSRVTLITRRKEDLSGLKAVNEGGQMLKIEDAASAEGTQITVRELFFNTPVRRKFLKSARQEGALASELMTTLALSHPQIAFRLSADGKTLLSSPGNGSLEGAAIAVYGAAAFKQFKKVDGQGQGLLIEGFVGVGDAARGNRQHQHFFINGRAIKSPLLSRAVEEASRHKLMVGRYPLCILYLSLPFDKVDVNVHPNKWEVRFVNEDAVFQTALEAVKQALQEGPVASPPPLFEVKAEAKPTLPLVSRADPTQPSPFKPQSAFIARDSALETPPVLPRPQVASSLETPPPEAAPSKDAPPKNAPLPVQELMDHEAISAPPKIKVLGQLFETYIIATAGDQMYLIDQHALHERLIFDRLMEGWRGHAAAQMLMIPEILSLSASDMASMQENLPLLTRSGFILEVFGPIEARVLALPMALGGPPVKDCLRDALDSLRQTGRLPEATRAERLMKSACRHAIKGGDSLPLSVLQSLVDQMLAQGTTPTCPHGRPLLVSLSRAELDRRFRRIL